MGGQCNSPLFLLLLLFFGQHNASGGGGVCHAVSDCDAQIVAALARQQIASCATPRPLVYINTELEERAWAQPFASSKAA